jgi:hypothetical protein
MPYLGPSIRTARQVPRFVPRVLAEGQPLNAFWLLVFLKFLGLCAQVMPVPGCGGGAAPRGRCRA